MGFNKLKSSTRRTTHLAEDPQMPKHRKLELISEQGKEGGRNKMTSFERILWLFFGIGCLLIIVILILLIVLWPYRELVGILVIVLFTLTVLVLLALLVIRGLTKAAVEINEANLRRKRLRPNDKGYYEIPLEGGEVPRFSSSETEHQEGQVPYSHGYTPKESYIRRWD